MTMERWSLAEHQRFAVFMMDCNPCMGIFYDMGCGKTAIALTWILEHLKDGSIEDALVVCPASIVPSWDVAMTNMINFEGVSAEDVELLRERVTVTSYQRTYRTEKRPVTHRDGRVTNKRTITLRAEVDKRWGAIILDESHKAGAHDSVTTKTMLALARLTDHRYIMTGTPVHGGGGKPDYKKLYGQLKFLDDRVWRNWTDFCERYVTRYNMWHQPTAYRDEECQELLQGYGIVCRLEEVFDMPGYTETAVPCPLAEKKVYKDVKEGRILEYGIDIEASGAQYNKMLQICSGSLITEDGTRTFRTSKDDALKDLLDSTEAKVVVFCRFRASIDRVAGVCRDCGRTVVVYDGRSKKDAWKDFQYGDADTIVCQYQSGSEGIDLFASSIEVLYEPCFSAKDLEQAKRRIYRKGQESPCVYYYLTTPGTIEDRVLMTVRSGVDVTSEMLDRWARERDHPS